MKNLLQNIHRERERVVRSEGSVVAVWAFKMSKDTRKKNKRQEP